MEQNRAPIIVSPRKVPTALVNFIPCVGDADPSANSSAPTQTTAATPPVKSVIVRAGPGPATSSVSIIFMFSKKVIIRIQMKGFIVFQSLQIQHILKSVIHIF